MNRAELVTAIASQTKELELTKKEVDAVLTAFTDTVTTTVASGEKVTIVGFGSFESRQRNEREGRNPKTGEAMTIPACVVPAFSAGKGFKEVVAGVF